MFLLPYIQAIVFWFNYNGILGYAYMAKILAKPIIQGPARRYGFWKWLLCMYLCSHCGDPPMKSPRFGTENKGASKDQQVLQDLRNKTISY